ncbi:unnamed protein product, partial [Polarella glacialis]
VSFEERDNVQIQDVDGERFCFYGNQVGGHFCLVKPAPESTRIVVKPNGPSESPDEIELPPQSVVLKPLDQNEHKFYKEILEQAPAFASHMAQLYGTKTLSHRQVSAMTAEVDKILAKEEDNFLETRMRSHQYRTYIVLQDLASSMKKPRIMDLKMGFKQRSQRHSLRKRERCRMKATSSTSHFLGFRICGIQREDRFFDKYWGRKMPLADMHAVLSEFFVPPDVSADDRHRILKGFVEKLQGMRGMVSSLGGWRFWSTSLLFLFDEQDLGAQPEVKMIDFAHCARVQSDTPDEEMLCSLWNIETFLQ